MRLWLLPLLLVLAGCQTAPSALPMAEPRPAAECRWPAGGDSPESLLRRAVSVLEAEGFLVRHTDMSLGLVSAERSRILPGYGDFDDPWERSGFFGHYGLGGRRGGGFSSGVGIMVGFGGASSLTRDATELERVSLVAGPEEVRVSRDIQVFDWRGERRQSRSASATDFCSRLRSAIEAMPAGEAP
ncbi:hypothetical protein [Halomonas heilongjiangensis]|uniref:DUF4136 domain-containing protein n=1 Tax=Halomonas heilongjiangensis TaxID=1387883 RepID=A0A2N7TFU1_9GAMM|nr:hypothetical protein [Halomonas heilongjiangensis]PMR67051.1 hypothetical protein C1H66_21385 [Halomonas heilongjiangensis]PXX88160.1 hypothetical protein CR158_15015 [Halomonas heilongjiangensis]